jgi:hypothetical protein
MKPVLTISVVVICSRLGPAKMGRWGMRRINALMDGGCGKWSVEGRINILEGRAERDEHGHMWHTFTYIYNHYNHQLVSALSRLSSPNGLRLPAFLKSLSMSV